MKSVGCVSGCVVVECEFFLPQVRDDKFFVDWEKGEVVILKGNDSVCWSDFAIKTVALVEAGLLTGYQAVVTRRVDHKTRHGFIAQYLQDVLLYC